MRYFLFKINENDNLSQDNSRNIIISVKKRMIPKLYHQRRQSDAF